jgi:hypothetical protein
MKRLFDQFLNVYPLDADAQAQVDADDVTEAVHKTLGVAVPKPLVTFWREVGGGFFGDRELYFFPAKADSGHRAIIDWNLKPYWEAFIPQFRPGHLVFFAETCFGKQLGFCTHDDGQQSIMLLDLDHGEMYLIADDMDALFSTILTESDVLTDQEPRPQLRKLLGRLPIGFHYAPLVSPLLGGSPSSSNYRIELADTHLLTAMALHQSLNAGDKL